VLDAVKLGQSLAQGKNAIIETVKQLPTHGEFLNRYFPPK
jgi:hypothetical protein